MGIESQLLRMLEPAVRPDGLGSPTRQPQVPIEARDFDALLAEAQKITEDALSPDETQAASKMDAMRMLGDVSRIENESLLRLIGGAAKNA